MKRKFLSTIVCLTTILIAILLLPNKASAAATVASGTCGNTTSWSLSDDGVLTISGHGPVSSYSYGSAPWSSYAAQINAIVVKNGITDMPEGIFYGCSNLENITIPFVGNCKIPSTSEYPFGYIFGTSYYAGSADTRQYYYGYISTIYATYYIPTSLKSVTITDGSLYFGAFYNCSNIQNVIIGDNVTSIGESAFYMCSSMQNITIGNHVTYIARNAFSNCSSLSNVYISDIAAWCNISFNNSFSNPLYYAAHLYLNKELLTDIIIPNGVFRICSYAFSNYNNLKSITIPDSVTDIASSAFEGCSNLSTVYITDVSSWCNIAFSSFSSNPLYCGANLYLGKELVTHLVIPESVTGIGSYAFYGCISLQSITIPDSVTSIGNNAFYNCSRLSTLNFNAPKCTTMGSYNYPVFSGTTNLINVNIGDNVTTIPAYMFYGCSNLQRITIPDNITTIGDYAFYKCSSLVNIAFGVSVTNIGKYAFCHCTNIENVIIPESVTNISDSSFSYCSSLTNITIPNSVTIIGSSAFSYCNNLTNVYLSDSVTTIGSSAFSYCKNLSNITIPDSITTIGNSAFFSCSNLPSITIPNSVTVIGSSAFSYCSNLACVYLSGNVTTIGSSAFSYCISLSTITIPDSVTAIDSYTFENCSSLSVIIIPDSVTTIGDSAFYGCSNLTSINLPDGLTSIGDRAFNNCSSLTIIAIPNSLTNIPNYAFSNCSSLTAITIPDSVTAIGSYAFANCNNLKHTVYTGTQIQWNKISIDYNNTALTGVLRHYETALIHTNNCAGTSVYCPVCEIYVYQSQNGNGIHTYGEWVVITPATLTATGQMTQTCTACGDAKIEFIEMLVGKVDHWNITLEDDYDVNFFLQVSESIEDTAKVQLSIGNETATYNVSDLEITEDGYFKLTANISAAQMNDFITVMVMNGRDIGSSNTYTVRQYCDAVLADSKHIQYHALVKEMLNYGAMAQRYFDYDAENLANDGITGTAANAVPDSAQELKLTDNIDGLDFYGASLVHRDRIAVRYYFTGDITGMIFTANGNVYSPIAKDGMYYVEVPDILPQNLDHQITLVVADTAGDTLSVSYSPMNYIVRMNQKDNVNLKNLLKALYNYHLAAKELSQSAA